MVQHKHNTPKEQQSNTATTDATVLSQANLSLSIPVIHIMPEYRRNPITIPTPPMQPNRDKALPVLRLASTTFNAGSNTFSVASIFC
jgi:hypothetical protein